MYYSSDRFIFYIGEQTTFITVNVTVFMVIWGFFSYCLDINSNDITSAITEFSSLLTIKFGMNEYQKQI